MTGRCATALLVLLPCLTLTPTRLYAAEQAGNAPLIAAASDLRFALEAIAERFHAETGAAVTLSFGSSGELARQIEQGAPFQMFLSADEAFVFELADRGKALDRGALYGIGRIAIFAPKGSVLIPDAQLDGLAAALAAGRILKFAIANPEHAPYGRAAEQALRARGLWDSLAPLLVLGENASQATQFAVSGSAQGGIIPYSLALTPAVSDQGAYALIPDTLHAPLRQRMVLLQGADDTTRAFYAYLKAPRAREILARFGFVAPEGAP
jgi:molybdate transport system substrate-binding protein